MKRNLHIAQAVILTCWVAAVLVTAYPGMVNAAILTVTTNSDTGDDFTIGADLLADTADGYGLSLREAMNWAVAGDTVTFNAGLAGSTITLNGAQLTFAKNIVMVGDLDSNGTPDITIDGNNASIVISMSGYLNVSARLDGFTITNGNSGTYGGGIYNSNTSATIINCIFSNNSAGHSGGGISNGSNAAPVITNCVFSGNTANSNGGAMSNWDATVTVTNCVFSGNTANSNGGAMSNYASNPTITNCIFSGNTANSNGGAMSNFDSNPTITNCIFWGDVPNEIYNSQSSPSVTYSDVQDGYAGTGNIKKDPLFVGGGDFHLQSQGGHWASSDWVNDSQTSPCIDAGNPASDFSNEPSPNGGRINMGAYGNTAQASKTPPVPEINLKQDMTNIADGGSFDFGSHALNTDTDVTFTIENTGIANLTLGTPIFLGGADAGQFSIQQQPSSPVLPSGITSVEGRFNTGACVAVVNMEGEEFARGLTSYSSDEIEKIKGKKSSRIEKTLGYKDYDEAIHRDNLVILKE